jgi:uncharacterized alpha-E superfamily protein
LTPGPYNATYFEQAFLAQYLGITLVQGADLTVRDRVVYLKTLGGLQAVDVILRRVRDDFCDPLELAPESTLGVPGLVEAARAGNVAIANPLGSGLLQTPAVMPYLPAVCRKLLGEDLLLPSVPTYWCGDPAALAYVEDHLADLVVRPAFPLGSGERIVAANLTRDVLEELRARIHADPRMYVAQRPFALSTTPTLAAGAGAELSPAPLWMRAYLVASGDSFEVMPGALSRVGAADERLALSLRVGGESKDTWILGGGPVSTFSLLKSPTATVTLSRGGADLPSRVADNLFWLGRYAERAEGTGRLVRAIGTRISEQSLSAETELGLDALFRAMTVETGIALAPASNGATKPPSSMPASAPLSSMPASAPPSSMPTGAPPDAPRPSLAVAGERAVTSAIFDAEPPGTLRAVIASAYRVARTLRDRISGDMWRAVAQLNQDVHERRPEAGPRAMGENLNLVNQILLALAAFSGLGIDSMSRGLGWRFLDAGRRLERALHIVTLLRATLGAAGPQEGQVLEAILETADSSMTYRRRYLATLQAGPVVDLLLADETNPRSVLYQVRALGDHLDALPREAGAPRSPQQLLLYEATASIQLADINAICTPGEGGERPRLQALLERLAYLLSELSNSLSGAYLNHASNVRPRTPEDDQ